LRRRFEQNQEDCTFTVLALLPTATTNILETMNTEKITYEIQQMKGSAKSVRSGSGAESAAGPPSIADTTLTEEESKSMASLQSDSGVHASQIATPSPHAVAGEGGEQDGGAQKSYRSKRQLWDDLTISGRCLAGDDDLPCALSENLVLTHDAAITRSFTLLYTLALLTMLTRIQLNLLGRRSYLSSVVALATGAQHATISLENNDDDNTDQAYGSDFDTNRKYLAFSWWLLNKGWVEIMHRVEGAVRTVFGSLSPRDLVSFQRFAELTMEVRKLVEGATPQERRKADWLRFLMPPKDQEDKVVKQSGILEDNTAQGGGAQPSSSALRRLLDETADLIESPSFSHVLTLILDSGFSTLVDKKLASEGFDYPNADVPISNEVRDLLHGKVVLLPKILSVLTRQAHAIGNGMPNIYLQDMEGVRDLEAFAAVVYSSNWQNEVSDLHVSASMQDTEASPQPQTQPPSQRDSLVQTQGEDSVVVVDSKEGLEGAWERAMEKSVPSASSS
jgi:peroxin-3